MAEEKNYKKIIERIINENKRNENITFSEISNSAGFKAFGKIKIQKGIEYTIVLSDYGIGNNLFINYETIEKKLNKATLEKIMDLNETIGKKLDCTHIRIKGINEQEISIYLEKGYDFKDDKGVKKLK